MIPVFNWAAFLLPQAKNLYKSHAPSQHDTRDQNIEQNHNAQPLYCETPPQKEQLVKSMLVTKHPGPASAEGR
eukprot:3792583-Amphidinium_carterae.1